MLFFELAGTEPLFYFGWVFIALLSICLHELAHGWAAIYQGDDTPIRLRRMTLNPLVNMGWFSIGALLVVGIAWGQMPINPSRFRSRWGEAIVAAAGPAMNVLLAIIGLTACSLLGVYGQNLVNERVPYVLYLMGWANLALAMFNLIPVPPLDGARILANFHPGYRRLIYDPSKTGFMTAVFLLIFFFGGDAIFNAAQYLSNQYLQHFSALLHLASHPHIAF